VDVDGMIIARLMRDRNSSDLVEWLRTVKKELPEFSVFMDFVTAAGLRFSEALASYNLIVELGQQNRLDEYYNFEQQTLEHYRFRHIFIRRTKKVFLSFVPKGLVEKIALKSFRITGDMIGLRLKRRRI
jgi:hypothetical protein